MNVQVFNEGISPKKGFSPMLYIPNGVSDISFYEKAFGAMELRRFGNDDGSVHVSELMIGDAMFHLHEETQNSSAFSPNGKSGATTVIIGLFVEDVHLVVENAIAAGATLSSPVQDYDYGYRQGNIIDPFGHNWQIQKVI